LVGIKLIQTGINKNRSLIGTLYNQLNLISVLIGFSPTATNQNLELTGTIEIFTTV